VSLFDTIKNGIQQAIDSVVNLIRTPVYPNNHLKDMFGRILIIHGLNVCNASKRSTGRLPWQTSADYRKFVTDWGFNGVRLLVFWSEVEPIKGQYNDEYLADIAATINTIKATGTWVMVDFHQDLYADKFTGDGAPNWAIHDDGKSFTAVQPWALNYLQPAVMTSFQNFWNSSLRDDYLKMITYAMSKIRAASGPGASNIIAVDVMNEPFKADLFNFESGPLTKLYQDAAFDMPNERIGAEPAILADAGLPTSLAFTPDPGKGLYVPHYYDAVFQTTGYNPVAEQIMWTAVHGRVNDANRMGMPLMFGEFGSGSSVSGYLDYVDQFIKVCDAHTCSWMWYAYDKEADSDMGILTNDGKERPIMHSLVRVFARAIGGSDPRFSTDGKKFTVTWKKAAGVTAPTEIFIPPRFTGIQVIVNGMAKPYTPSPARPNVLNVSTTADNMKVEVLWA